MQVKTEIIEITPDFAGELLRLNTRNRPLDKRRANRIAGDIRRGEWHLNGDAIRISSCGVLLDGQHRLMAILLGGKAVHSILVTGLPLDTFKTIDVDRKARTASDILAVQGTKHYTVVAAVARLVYKYEACGNPFSGNPDLTPTAQQCNHLATERAGIMQAAGRTATRKWCKKFIAPSVTGFCDYAFTEAHPEYSEEFMSKLESGSGLQDGSPILMLRERLMGAAGDKESIKQTYKTALIFKAFRLFMDGAQIKTLRVRTGGDAPEKNLFLL